MSLLTAEDRALLERARQIKERPILFSAPMVRALLDGRKTQTRRQIKGVPIEVVRYIGANDKPTGEFGLCFTHSRVINKSVKCPYGAPGDRLWVRETHYVDCAGYQDGSGKRILYRASDPDAPTTWTPSIHMPRWASRLTLEVTEVRVERLQAISCDDAAAEGLVKLQATGRYAICKGDQYFGGADRDPRTVYRRLWESINGAGAWDVNPWVWAVSFRVLDQAEQVSA